MEIIRQASIYKFLKDNRYLIHGLSRIQMGASITSEPFIWLDCNSVQNVIIESIIRALKQTKLGLPNPKDWNEFNKGVLKKMSLKSSVDLYKDSILVSIINKDGELIFTPMKNLKRKGFVNVSKEKFNVAVNSTYSEIFDVLQLAFSKCEK